jgi:hypothetical protein
MKKFGALADMEHRSGKIVQRRRALPGGRVILRARQLSDESGSMAKEYN